MKPIWQILSALVITVVLLLIGGAIDSHYQAVQRIAAQCETTPLP